jgi:transcriptional regulator with XRE-family HTH domain
VRSRVPFIVPDSAAILQRQFGTTLRAERKQRDLTQQELAFEAGLSLTYIGEIERGERMISLDTLRRLAGALDLTCSELLARARL